MQETRVADGDTLRAAEQTARISKWNLSLAPCRVTECGGKSAGVAVATKSHIGMAVTEPGKLSQGLHQQGRFAIRRVGAICRGGLHLGSTYLTSGVGVEAKCNLDHLQTMAHTLNGLVGPWCVGGRLELHPRAVSCHWVASVGQRRGACAHGSNLQRQDVRFVGRIAVLLPCCSLHPYHWRCWIDPA